MLELVGLGTTMTIILLIAVSGVVSWALTQLVKKGMNEYYHNKGAKKQWWWNTVLRVLAILVGASAGVLLMTTWVGFLVGLGAGSLNTVIVAAVKSKIKSYGSTDEDA